MQHTFLMADDKAQVPVVFEKLNDREIAVRTEAGQPLALLEYENGKFRLYAFTNHRGENPISITRPGFPCYHTIDIDPDYKTPPNDPPPDSPTVVGTGP